MSDVARVMILRNATYDEGYKFKMPDIARVMILKMPDMTRVNNFKNVRYDDSILKMCKL